MTKQRKGFTLVELSIVLIIIGLIIGGVLKGTDLINSAKTKKVYTTWIKGWQIAVNTYEDKTGQVLGDGIANGSAAGTVDGLRNATALTAAANTIQTRLRQVGLDVPVTSTGGGPGVAPDGGSYRIEGKYVTTTSVATLTNQVVNGSARNVFQLTLVPLDVAMALDTMIDGVADSGLGDFRLNNAAALTAPPVATPWALTAATGTTVGVTILF